MAYIKVPPNFHSLPKIRSYINRCVKDLDAGLPLRIACLCANEAPGDGRLAYPSAHAVELACGWSGRPGQGIKAMIEAGLMEKDESGFRFLGWDESWEEEQGHIVKLKERAKRAIRARWDKRNGTSSNTPRITSSKTLSSA